MIRKIAIVMAAVAAVTAGSVSTASARFGGGFGGGHGMGGGFHSMGGGFHSSGFSHSFAQPGFSHFNHFGHDRFFGHHRFFGPRFGAFGVGYPYGYYDGCYSRVWTPWGWRWQYVCY
jgi:hypothetical protein